MMTGTSGRIALTLGSISRPVMPGMLISDRIRISDCSIVEATRASASAAELAKSITNRCARKSLRNCWRNNASTSGSSSTTSTKTFTSNLRFLFGNIAGPGQHDPELGELPRRRFDVDGATMLFHDDVVAHRQAKAGAFARGLCREERVEHLVLHVGRDAGAVVANTDLHSVAEITGCGAEHRIEPGIGVFVSGLVHVVQFVGQLRRQCGKVVDEVERVLDLVRNAGRELAK